MRILFLYNIARDLKKGEEADLICEQEITIIVPLVSDALSARGHQVEMLETTFDLWEKLKTKRELTDLVVTWQKHFEEPTRMRCWFPPCLKRLIYLSPEQRRIICTSR